MKCVIGHDGKTCVAGARATLAGRRGSSKISSVYGRLEPCHGAARALKRCDDNPGERCPYREAQVFFLDEQSAIAAGFRPCAHCFPEKYQAWKAAQEA